MKDPVKQAWQSSVESAAPPPLDEVRAGADKFYRLIRRRNRIEYAAGVVVVAAFGGIAFTSHNGLERIGAVLTVVAALLVLWQLHRRASAIPTDAAGTMPIYAFIRAQLVRQRDALKSVFWWYILPFLPGLAISISSKWGIPGGARVAAAELRNVVTVAIVLAVLAGIWWLNQRGARALQVKIDEIDALTGGRDENLG